MRIMLMTFSVLCTFLLQAQESENQKESEPTLQVKKAFEKDFPKVKPVWRKEFNGDGADQLSYEADFSMNNTNMTAVYNALGIFRDLEVELKPADIPAKISRYMERNYPKNNIKKAARLITNTNKITYEIGITINGQWVDAIFNKEGDFLRMVPKD